MPALDVLCSKFEVDTILKILVIIFTPTRLQFHQYKLSC